MGLIKTLKYVKMYFFADSLLPPTRRKSRIQSGLSVPGFQTVQGGEANYL